MPEGANGGDSYCPWAVDFSSKRQGVVQLSIGCNGHGASRYPNQGRDSQSAALNRRLGRNVLRNQARPAVESRASDVLPLSTLRTRL